MKRAAGTAGSCPSASVARTRLRLHRCTLIRALLVATVLLTPGLVSARQFPAPATPSETFRASSQQNASAAAALPGDPFSLTLDALHSQGLRRHSRSLKQSSCPNAGIASLLYLHRPDRGPESLKCAYCCIPFMCLSMHNLLTN